jgi:hypothetical protein
MTRIDIDEIERKARAVLEGGETFADNAQRAHDLDVATPAEVMLALVARIRELEGLAGRALDGWQQNHECEVDYTEEEALEIEAGRVILAKGVVLP